MRRTVHPQQWDRGGRICAQNPRSTFPFVTSHKDVVGLRGSWPSLAAHILRGLDPRSQTGIYTWNYFPFSSLCPISRLCPACRARQLSRRDLSRRERAFWACEWLGCCHPSSKPGRGALAVPAGQGCRWLGSSPFHMLGSQALLPASRSHRFPPRPCSQHHQLGFCSSCAGSPVDMRGVFSGAGVGHFKNAAANFLKGAYSRAGGFISEDAASPDLPLPHPSPAHRQDLPISSPTASCKRVFTKNIMKAWKGTGCCPVSACLTQKQVRSLDITKKKKSPTKKQWADFCSLALGQFLWDPWGCISGQGAEFGSH